MWCLGGTMGCRRGSNLCGILKPFVEALEKVEIHMHFYSRPLHSSISSVSPGKRERYEEDIWTEIAKFLDGRSLVMLTVSCKWFTHIMMEDGVWKYASLRDLELPDPGKVSFKWIKLYAAALESIMAPLRIQEETMEKMLKLNSCCAVNNIKPGIWTADLQLLQCTVCDLPLCDETMQTLEARHVELFLSDGYLWDYDTLRSGDITLMELLQGFLALSISRIIQPLNDWQPKTMTTLHAVAVNTDFEENEGLKITYQAMKAGKDGAKLFPFVYPTSCCSSVQIPTNIGNPVFLV